MFDPVEMSHVGVTIQPLPVRIPLAGVTLNADLTVPDELQGVVVFAHGSGSSRRSPRNRAVAERLQEDRFATVLLDLLTEEEDELDERTRELRFDIPLLAHRLVGVIDWARRHPALRDSRLGLFGASTGAAAALIAAARRPSEVSAVVSRGGRPDLAYKDLDHVRAPTLLIVGGYDTPVIDFNRGVMHRLQCVKSLAIVPRATHLFEEPGALGQVTHLARDWFRRYLV